MRDDVVNMAAETCKKAGAGEWEVFCIETKNFYVESNNRELESLESSAGCGIAVRLRVEGRPGFSYTADLTKESVELAVRAAVSGASAADPEPDGAFATPGVAVSELDIWDEDFDRAEQSEKIARAVSVEEAAMAVDPRIKKVRSASYSEKARVVRIVNHLGMDLSSRSNICSSSVMTVAEDGKDSQSAWEVAHSPKWARLDFEGVGRRAAMDALELLGAKTMPTQKSPVLLRNTAACDLVEVLSESFSGEAVAKGRSMLAGKAGKKIFGDLITLVDDGLLEGGADSFPFDGEGVRRRKTTLVEAGVLKGYLYDLPWARKSGTESTGNASRGGYTAAPTPSKTNLYIKPGTSNVADAIEDMGSGLLVAELMGVHTANQVTGDFSVGARGWRIEDGGKTHPVQGVTIAGNIMELLAMVDVVCDDLKFYGQVGSPSLRVPALDIGGS